LTKAGKLETPSHREENANVAFISIPRVHGTKINATVSWRGKQPGGGEGSVQLFSFMKLTKCNPGLLINFNESHLKKPASSEWFYSTQLLPLFIFLQEGFLVFSGSFTPLPENTRNIIFSVLRCLERSGW
jgi:hypothetical protein